MFLEFNATRQNSETVSFKTKNQNDSYIESVLVQSMLEHKLDYVGFRAKLWKRCNKKGFHTRMGQCIKSKICVCSNGVPREGLFCRQNGQENCKSCHPGYKMTKSRKCQKIIKNPNVIKPKSQNHIHIPIHRVHDLRQLSF